MNNATPPPTPQPVTGAPKGRIVYILLAVFLGHLGIHNFFAGYKRNAIIQLVVTIVTCGFGGLVTWIWAIVEACTVTKDADGVNFS